MIPVFVMTGQTDSRTQLWAPASYSKRAAMGGWVHDICGSYLYLTFIVLTNICTDEKMLQETQSPVYRGNKRNGCVSEMKRRWVNRKVAEQRALADSSPLPATMSRGAAVT